MLSKGTLCQLVVKLAEHDTTCGNMVRVCLHTYIYIYVYIYIYMLIMYSPKHIQDAYSLILNTLSSSRFIRLFSNLTIFLLPPAHSPVVFAY